MKAWRVNVRGYPEIIRYGQTRGVVIYDLWLRSGSDNWPFRDFLKMTTAHRAPEHDRQEVTA